MLYVGLSKMGLKKTGCIKTEFRKIVTRQWYATLCPAIQSHYNSFETSSRALVPLYCHYFHFIHRHQNFMSISMFVSHQNVLEALVPLVVPLTHKWLTNERENVFCSVYSTVFMNMCLYFCSVLQLLLEFGDNYGYWNWQCSYVESTKPRRMMEFMIFASNSFNILHRVRIKKKLLVVLFVHNLE